MVSSNTRAEKNAGTTKKVRTVKAHAMTWTSRDTQTGRFYSAIEPMAAPVWNSQHNPHEPHSKRLFTISTMDWSQSLTCLRQALEGAQTLSLTGMAPRLSTESLSAHWALAFSSDELSEIVIPQRTLARRKNSGEPLTVDETERALRLARIASEAARVFADPQKAARWLRKPNRALNAHAPMALLVTETGARAVEELLGQIDYGFFA